jgi:hypothetical protein
MATTQDELQSGHEEESQEEVSQEGVESGSESQTSDNAAETNSNTTSKRAEERAKRRVERSDSENDYKRKLEMMQKEDANRRSLYDRQFQELQNQQKELLKHKDMLNQIAELKKKSELEQLKQSSPDEYQKRVMQDMIEEKLKAQAEAINNNNPNGAQQQASVDPQQLNSMALEATRVLMQDPEVGEQRYKIMEPVMREIIASSHPNNIPILLANPKELFQFAVGRQYLAEAAKNVQKEQQGIQKANKFHAGTAKPNAPAKSSSSSFDNMSDKELEAAKNAEILRQYNLSK